MSDSIPTIPGSWSPQVRRTRSETNTIKKKRTLSFSFKRAKSTSTPNSLPAVLFADQASKYKNNLKPPSLLRNNIVENQIDDSNVSTFSFEDLDENELIVCANSINSKLERNTSVIKSPKSIQSQKEYLQNINDVNSKMENTNNIAESAIPDVSGFSDSTGKDPRSFVEEDDRFGDQGDLIFKDEVPKGAKIPPPVNHFLSKLCSFFIIFIFILFFILLGFFIPAVILLVKNYNTTILDRFHRMDPETRKHVLDQLNNIYAENQQITLSSKENTEIPFSTILPQKNSLEYLATSPVYKSNNSFANETSLSAIQVHGVAYAPREPHKPCTLKYDDVLLDMIALSKITTRVRNYAVHCKQAEYIILAILKQKLNLTLALGIWIGSEDKVNEDQFNILEYLLDKFGSENVIDSIYIGNEVLFRAEKTKQQLIDLIRRAKKLANDKNLDILVGTSELGSLVDNELVSECDIIGINLHPFFTGIDVHNAVQWVFHYLKYELSPKLSVKNQRKLVITEVGWPFGGGTFHNAVANPENGEIFFNQFKEAAYSKNLFPWYYFEAFDEPWKEIFYEGNNTWETEWGVFDINRNFKIT